MKKKKKKKEKGGKIGGGIQSDKGKRAGDRTPVETHPPGIFTQFFPIACHLSTNCFFIVSNPIRPVKESILHSGKSQTLSQNNITHIRLRSGCCIFHDA